MHENINWNNSANLENEIAELSKQIEIKRKQLESENGIVSDKEIVSEIVGENFNSLDLEAKTDQEQIGLGSSNVPLGSTSVTKNDDTYLNSLDENSVSVVNDLVALVPEKGLSQAIILAISHGPFILDVFHDVLVDKLYEELKSRKLVN